MKIQNLLEVKEDGQVSGPMSPVSFMQEMRKYMGEQYNRLARVRFDNPEVHQIREQGEGLTGYDTLIMGVQSPNDLLLTLWIDTGTKAVPCAMMFQSDKELTVTPRYRAAEFESKLPDAAIEGLFEEIFEKPELIEPENIEQLA